MRPRLRLQARGAVPARRRVLRRLLARAAPRRGAGRQAVRRQLPLLLVVLRRAAPAQPRERAAAHRRSRGLGPRASSSRSRATTATCSRTSPSSASRCSASTRRPTRPRPPTPAGVPTLAAFFGVGARRRAGGGGQARRRHHRQQRDGARPGPQRRRWPASPRCSPTTASSSIENPYVRDLIDHVEFDTIYHEHLCYHSCTAIDRLAAPPRPAPEPRRELPATCTAARCAGTSASATQRSAGSHRVPRVEEASPGLDSLRVLRGLRQAGRSTCATTLHALLEGLKRRRQDDRGVRRGGQGQRRS